MSPLNGQFDRLGATLAMLMLAAGLLLPLVNLQPNRIVPGEGIYLWQLLFHPAVWMLLLLMLPTLTIACRVGWLRGKLWLASALLMMLLLATGLIASPLLVDQTPFARLSLGSGFWCLLLCVALLISDTFIKLALGPLARLMLVVGYAVLIGAMLTGGHWDDLSLLKEFHNQTAFWQQGMRHLLLAFGSILPALILGVPLGIACHRNPRVRALVMPILNLLQTIPSLAMFGLLMVPLSMLALRYPLLAELGIRGIGVAPAVLALFFYSLLPIVGNTAAGFDKLDPAVIEAARGMGMNRRQRLWQIELPLALPVMLSGLRIVVTMNIGLVAVAGLIGGGGYGTYIFQGLGQTATDLVLLGALPTVLLAFISALLIDTLIALLKTEQA